MLEDTLQEQITTLKFEYHLATSGEEIDLYKDDDSLTGEYQIFLHGTNIRLGYIEYFEGNTTFGNIGYEIITKYRGHNYACKSAILLFRYLFLKGIKEIYITAYNSNIPSIVTMEKIAESDGIAYVIVDDGNSINKDLARYKYVLNEKILEDNHEKKFKLNLEL